MCSQVSSVLKLIPASRSVNPPASPPGAASVRRAEADSRATRKPGRPRVLMVVESSSGGTGRHVLDLSEGLAARGCEVHVLYSTGRADRFFVERVRTLEGVRCAALPMRTSIHPADFLAVRATRRYLSAHGPFDVIHGHSSKGGAVARLASLGKGVAAFYTLHGLVMMDPGLARWKRMLYLSIELALSLRTARIIAVAPEERRAAVRLGLGSSRVMLVPNGVGPADLTPRDLARRQVGVAEDEFVIGFIGRMVSQKAPDVLVRAMPQVAERFPNARLVMVGAGPLDDSLRALAVELGVADRIVWTGERHAASVLAAFDTFTVSSCKEGLPYVVLEAMAAGLPVVAANTAGVESLVDTGVNGVVVPCGDVPAFAAALAALAADPATRDRYGRTSLERVSHFSIDAMVERTLAAYREVLDANEVQAAPSPQPAVAPVIVPPLTVTAAPVADLELVPAMAGEVAA